MLTQRLRIMYFLVLGSVLVFASAQPSPSAVPAPTNASPSMSPNPTGRVPTTFAGSQIRTTSDGKVPITKVAATEHTLNVGKPTTAPLSTKPDTWNPIGFTGTGKPWQPMTGRVNAPELPYDTSKSQMTIGEQILQQQQQQQQLQQAPVEYDMFGFPVNTAADPFDPFAGLFDFAAPTPAPADPYFGSFGGAVRDTNQGVSPFGGSNLFGGPAANPGLLGGFGRGGGQNPMGNMMQTMMLMQLLGGGDAPDPPSTPAAGGRRGRGRGRGRGPISQLSPIERALLLEERRIMRENQRNQARMNRQFPGNQGWQQGPPNGGQAPWNQVHQNPNRWNPAPRAPQLSPRTAREVIASRDQGSSTRYEYPAASATANIIPMPPRSSQSSHPAVHDRSNMVTQKSTLKTGQEPVEREAGNAQQRRNRFSSDPTSSTSPQGYTSSPGNNASTKTYPTAQGTGALPARFTSPPIPRTTVSNQNLDPINVTPTSITPFNNNRGWNNAGATVAQGQGGNGFLPRRNMAGIRRGFVAVPRNLQQLMSSPQFQRNLRTSGSFPSANPADVQADRADLMADRMDNMQSISPFQRLLNAQTGFAGILGSSSFGGMGVSPLGGMGVSPLARLMASPLARMGATPLAGMAGRRGLTPQRPTEMDTVLGSLFG